MKHIKYKVYEREPDKALIVSYSDLESHTSYKIGKRKFVGKKAKIEAIFRLTGIRLSNEYTTEQVNQYLSENLFGTSAWYQYRRIYNEVVNEKVVSQEEYIFKYNLLCELSDEGLNLPPDDAKVIYFVSTWLSGESVAYYQGINNPFISIKKDE